VSGLLHRTDDHDRALDLAALRIDEALDAADAAWLDGHLALCDGCADTAEELASDADLFAPLRETAPTPPRDLWARTAAAIDAERGARRGGFVRGRVFGVPAAALAPVAGVAVVALVASSLLLNGQPVVPVAPGTGVPVPTAIAMGSGDVAVLTRNPDGTLEYRTGGLDEVCPLVAEDCAAAAPSFSVAQVAGLDAGGDVAAIISPTRDRLVVVQRSSKGSDGVFVVPVKPRITAASSPHATEAPTAAATVGATRPPATTAASAVPASDAPATSAADPSASVAPSDVPASDAPGSASPTDRPAPTDEPTAAPTDKPSHEPTPAPTVAVTPKPDGTLEIASDVVVVGSNAAYTLDGSLFAFTARPSDGSRGPDVFVWDTSETKARAVTHDHRSVFAGWAGSSLLVSRVTDGTAHTVMLSARSGARKGDLDVAAWLPVVSPDGGHAAWWDGTVKLGDDGVTWVPDKGRLVLGAWPAEASADVQVLARGEVDAFEVRWSEDGSAVAAWTGGDGVKASGSITIYAVDRETGRAKLGAPILEDEPAYAGFSVEAGRLVYAAPGKDGKRAVWVFGWHGATVGKVRLAGDAGTTVVR
jgi:hypothetical protein